MKILLTLLSLGIGTSLASADCEHETQLLAMAGFTVLEDSAVIRLLKFRDETPFAISKERFKSSDEAAAFCRQNQMTFDENGFEKALLIAMSGAANASPALRDAISFKINDEASGIWAWSGEKDKIITMFDGHGTGTEIESIENIRDAIKQQGSSQVATLPAICR